MVTAERNTITGMGFEGFVNVMKEHLQARYPDCDIKVVHVDKNNGLRLTGITILPEGQTVVPTIYMEDFYKDFQAGRWIDDIVADVVQLYEENKLQEDFILPDVTDFEVVKDIVCFKLINRERNREKLSSMPHRDFLDLAIVYFIPVSIDGGKGGTITVTDNLFSQWQTDEETVYQYALKNTKRLYPVIRQSMEDVIRDMMGADAPTDLFSEKNGVPAIPMFVLRCHKGDMTKAAAVLYDDILREFGQAYGNFYILPSSIFEVLLMPTGCPPDSTFVCPVVRGVNAGQVAPDEILSDNAYDYHADTGEIEILS